MRRVCCACLAIVLLSIGCGDDGLNIPSDDTGNDSGAPDQGTGDADAQDGDAADLSVPDGGYDLSACRAGDGVEMTTSDGGVIEFPLDGPVRVAVEVPARAVSNDRQLSLQCGSDDITPEGAIALSAPVTIDFTGQLDAYARVTIPFDRGLFPNNADPSAIRLFLQPRNAERVLSPPAIDLQESIALGFVTFSTREAGTYQVAVDDDAGETYEREWQFRAITGVSMGCSGAAMIGLRNPEAFDIIGALGGPASWTYLMHYIKEGGFGGFGPAPDFGAAPKFEPTEEFEHNMAFNDFYFPTGEGTGGTFDRGEYVSILQDLALAFGNLAAYSGESPYLPPGVDVTEMQRAIAERCPGTADSVLTIESGYYDDEYNPDGDLPVIMFCDGVGNQDRTIEFDRYCDLDENGVPDQPNRGLYPGPESQDRPVLIAWAVDVNGNGQRDLDEPVIRNFNEPFEDVGSDGLASADEPGYDAVENPDPGGDDYDYFHNPHGTEGNWLYDDGEPYSDTGLDGVPDTPQLTDDGGYDFGEGNEQFDYNPFLAALFAERDPHHTVANLTQSDWDELTIYLDAGIRDLFNFGVSANQLAGQIQATGQNLRIHNGFFSVANLDPELDDYRFNEVGYETLGDHVFLRYGDPEADEEQICVGDGKHVGPPGQVANRLLTMLGFITARFPAGEVTPLEPPFPTPNGSYRFESEALGAVEQYSIILPPGHERTACSDGQDNDEDGLTDGADRDCEHGMDNDEAPGLGVPLCRDGLDNDLDGQVDAEEDADCAGPDDTSEWPAEHPLRTARFPVVYLLHGYGQTPDDLRATVVPFAGFMGGGFWQKVIVVYPDGFCGDNDRNQCNDGVDNDEDELIDADDPECADSNGRGEDGTAYPRCADGVDNDDDGLIDEQDGGCVGSMTDDESECVKGNFYTNHEAAADGSSPGPAFEDAFFDLVEHIDEVYRTRPPESVQSVR